MPNPRVSFIITYSIYVKYYGSESCSRALGLVPKAVDASAHACGFTSCVHVWRGVLSSLAAWRRAFFPLFSCSMDQCLETAGDEANKPTDSGLRMHQGLIRQNSGPRPHQPLVMTCHVTHDAPWRAMAFISELPARVRRVLLGIGPGHEAESHQVLLGAESPHKRASEKQVPSEHPLFIRTFLPWASA